MKYIGSASPDPSAGAREHWRTQRWIQLGLMPKPVLLRLYAKLRGPETSGLSSREEIATAVLDIEMQQRYPQEEGIA